MAEEEMIRTITVDDHELVRRGIGYSLLSVDDIELVGEAGDGVEALALCIAKPTFRTLKIVIER